MIPRHSIVRSSILLILILILVGGAVVWTATSAGSSEPAPLRIFSASSTAGMINELANLYQKETGQEVQVNLASSGSLARQIAHGAPADLYLSASVQWMDHLESTGEIEQATRHDLLSNRLVLVSPRSQPLQFSLTAGQSLPAAFAGPIAVGDPSHVPAGGYAKEALEHFGWFAELSGRLTHSASARSALLLVERGEVAAGIVYRSDAVTSQGVTIVAEFPAGTHSEIVYPIAAIHDASPQTNAFLAWLDGDVARGVISRWGLSATAEAPPAEVRQVTSSGADCLGAIQLSLKVAVVSVLLLTVPSIAVGWLLARKQFVGKRLLSTLVYVPLVVPPVATGYLLLVILGVNGPIGAWLDDVFGIRLAFHWFGAAVASAVVAFPLMVRSVRLAMDAVDVRLESASRALGITPVRTFLGVTVPLAWPGILAGAVLAFARSMGEFGATVTFAGNLAGQTRTLPLAAFGHMQTPGGESAAMQLVIVSVGLSVFSIVMAEWLAGRTVSANAARAK